MNGDPGTPAEHPPTDLELMLYADDELEGARSAAVEAYLARTAEGRGKLRALRVTSSLVRESALLAAGSADSIADAVMARIARVPQAAPAPTLDVAPLHGGANVVPLHRPKPANDNGRGIFALLAVAFAAAASVMLWSRGRPEPAPASFAQQAPIRAPATAALNPPTAPTKVADSALEGDAEHGVEVAAVDFGARMGSIFYVPTGAAASNATTTVVWLNDDAAGEEQ